MFRITELMFAKLQGGFWCLLVACRQLRYSGVIQTAVPLWKGIWQYLEQRGENKYIVECTETN